MNKVATRRATEIEEIDPQPVTVDMNLAVGLTRAEIDVQISTAKNYPRSITRSLENIKSLATLTEETAEACMYSVPRAGKAIEGASIRFAEIVQQSWGNNRVAARVVFVDREDKFLEAEGVYHDLETNSATMARVRRRIVDKRGKLFNEDMILTTGNAACSIARRNAILGGVPRPVWNVGYDEARKVVMGDVKTLANRRAEAIKQFQRFGVTAEQIYAALRVKGENDIDLELLVSLRGMWTALKNGEETVESMFADATGPAPPRPKLGDFTKAEQVAETNTDTKIAQTASNEDEKRDTPENPMPEFSHADAHVMGIEARDAGKPIFPPSDMEEKFAATYKDGWRERDAEITAEAKAAKK